MNWTTQADNTDRYLNTSLYGGTSVADGIDLRIELNRILYGTATQNPKGHWVVLRKFNRSVESTYFHDGTKEGVGGPAYNYVNYNLRTRRVPVSIAGKNLVSIPAGMDMMNTYIYYFEHSVKPKVGDQIFELNWDDHSIQPPSVSTLSLTEQTNLLEEKYTIKAVHPYRLEYGRVEYYSCVAEFDELSY